MIPDAIWNSQSTKFPSLSNAQYFCHEIPNGISLFNAPVSCFFVFMFFYIVCLQETHWATLSVPNFSHKKIPHIFHASASKKQKGVLIAIRSVAFSLQETHADPEGRYLILVREFNNYLYTIVNLYAPNTHQLRFLKKLFNEVNSIKKGAVIMCGDYNITVDYKMDTTSKSKRPLPSLQYTLRAEEMYDAWRCQHSNKRDYSFHSSRHNSYSHIDLILVDRALLQ